MYSICCKSLTTAYHRRRAEQSALRTCHHHDIDVGAAHHRQKGSLGFAYDNSSMSEEKIRDAVMGELKNIPPEFLNRVDDIIVFSASQRKTSKKSPQRCSTR